MVRSKAFVSWLALTTLTLLVVILVLSAPLGLAIGYSTTASVIYKTFGFICHQIPERSFHLAGNKLAVCSRCTGIYVGLAAAALTYPLARPLAPTDPPRLVWLFLAAAPLAIDWSLGYFSIWQNNQASRFGTGFLLGAAAVFYILPGLIDWSFRLTPRRLTRGG
jgi:uncharacterized membrane protein